MLEKTGKYIGYHYRDQYLSNRKEFESKEVQGATFSHYIQTTADGKYTSFYIKVFIPSRIFIEIRIPFNS